MNVKNVNPDQLYQKQDDTTFRFFKSPKVLFYSPLYRKLSLGAKSLYSLLLDRLELSLKNQWVDDQGYIFVYFRGKPASDDPRKAHEKSPRELSLTELLDVDQRTLRKYKDELIAYNLLLEKRSGLGKSNRLYVLKPKTVDRDLPEKEAREESPDPQNSDELKLMKSRKFLQLAYGEEALEKALAMTKGIEIPPKDYYNYMADLLESQK